MAARIQYLDSVPFKGTCKLADDTLTTSTNHQIIFPADGGELALKSDIGEQQTPANVEVDTTALEEDISAVSTKVDSLTSTLNTANTNISTINSDISTINTNINTIKSDVSTAKTTADSANSTANTIKTNLTTLQSSINTMNNNFTTALIKAAHPVNSVLINTDNTTPNTKTGFAGTTWSKLGTATVGSTTIYYWKRTA